MKKLAVASMLCLSLSAAARGAEPFTDIAAGLTSGRPLAWGDYNNDGDLDLALARGGVSKVYQNQNGAFADIGAGLGGISGWGLAWGDYDNDGDLDLALAGGTGGSFPYNPASKVYRNDGGGVFTDIGAGLTGVCYASLDWGDYDNDGDLDLALAGSSPGTISKVYRNDNGTFIDIGAALQGVTLGRIAWGDYDNDGDLDLALTGHPYVTKVYRNDGGVFMDAGAGLPGLKWSTLDWGDYDNDGDLDLAVTGDTGTGYVSRIYRNNGGTFVDIGAGLTGVYRGWGGLAWGDYDNDGDLDLALMGIAGGRLIWLYRNDAGTFTEVASGLPACSWLAWGDFDNDGDLDLAIMQGSGGTIYRNNNAVLNVPPSAPSGLTASYTGTGPYDVTFSWSAATDTETPQAGLAYNLRVGTSPGGGEVVSGMADSASGYRHIPAIGNAQKMLSWTLKGLPADTYYWTVQAIDTAFAGSAWAAEQTACVPGPGVTVTLGLSAATEGDGVLGIGTVGIERSGKRRRVTVTLTSDDTTEATVPADVVIPAGSTSVDFNVTIVDDTEGDGDQTVTIFASATGYSSGSDAILVQDNEPHVTPSLILSAAAEGDGTLSIGMVNIPVALAAPLTVTLSSDDTTEATVPTVVIIPAGLTSVGFDVTIVDDTVIDGDQTVTISASAAGYFPESDSMLVQDNEQRRITLWLPVGATEGRGTLVGWGRVTIPGTWASDLVIGLASSDTTELTVPATVTIPQGYTTATFDVTVIEDGLVDGRQTVVVTASAAGWTRGLESIDVLDNGDDSNLTPYIPPTDIPLCDDEEWIYYPWIRECGPQGASPAELLCIAAVVPLVLRRRRRGRQRPGWWW